MTARALPALVLALSLAGCGDAADRAVDATAAPAAPADAPAADGAPGALSGTPPAGSLGAITLRFAESDVDGAPASEVAAYLPAPVPEGAFPTFELVDAPSYHAVVDKATLPDGFELPGTHFVYVKRDADGGFDKAHVLRSWVGLSNSTSSGTLSGTVGGFTFAPLWPDGAPEPGLVYETIGDDKARLGTSPLAVMPRPVWAHPLTLPATVEDPVVTAELDVDAPDLDGLGATLYLLYREADSSRGEPQWNLEDVRPDRSAARARKGDPAAPSTVPVRVYPDGLGDGPTEAYLLAFGD